MGLYLSAHHTLFAWGAHEPLVVDPDHLFGVFREGRAVGEWDVVCRFAKTYYSLLRMEAMKVHQAY